MFKLLGGIVLCYVAYSLYTGRTFAKRGPWGRSFARDAQPFGYWSALAVYVLLAAALITVF
jgi:hypothetical protein